MRADAGGHEDSKLATSRLIFHENGTSNSKRRGNEWIQKRFLANMEKYERENTAVQLKTLRGQPPQHCAT